MAQFTKGTSGNPAGKPPGTVSKRTHLARLLDPYAEELILKAVELARDGDVTALKLCIERIIPKVKDDVTVILPDIDGANITTPFEMAKEILKMLSGQELSLDHIKFLLGILKYSSDISVRDDKTHGDEVRALCDQIVRELEETRRADKDYQQPKS